MILAKWNPLWTLKECSSCFPWLLPLLLIPALLGLWWAWNHFGSWLKRFDILSGEKEHLVKDNEGLRQNILALKKKQEEAKRAKVIKLKEEKVETNSIASTPTPVAPITSTPVATPVEPEEEVIEEEPEPDRPTNTSGYTSYLGQYEGEDVEAQPQPGVIFKSRPSCVDDLKEISGVGPALEKVLHENGVYRFQQVADWNEYNVWYFNQIISFPGRIQRDEWIKQGKELAPQSKCLAGAQGVSEENIEEVEPERPTDTSGYTSYLGQYQGEDVEAQPQPGVIFKSRPSCVDDLKEISGVGPALEKLLHDNGVYRFQQVADWNEYNVWFFNKELSFPGRIQRDEWIKQGKELAPKSKCLAGYQEPVASTPPVSTGGGQDHFSYTSSKGTLYYLYSRQQELKNADKSVTLYYFSKDPNHPKGDKVYGLPEGRKVAETATGMLVLKKDE